MLATNDPAAVDSLTAFATTMDYTLDNDGKLAYEYDVPLDQVQRFIACWECPSQISWQAGQ